MLLFCYEIDIVSEAAQPAATSTPGNSFSLSFDLLEQLKAQLPESLFAAVSAQLGDIQRTVVSYKDELQYRAMKIQLLEEKLRLQRIAKYGPGSEKLSNLQLELLELEPGVSTRKWPPRANATRCHPLLKRRRGASILAARLCPPIFPAWSG